MSTYIATGNRLDLVLQLDLENNSEKIAGLYSHEFQKFIPLPDSKGLAEVLNHEISRLEKNEKTVSR